MACDIDPHGNLALMVVFCCLFICITVFLLKRT